MKFKSFHYSGGSRGRGKGCICSPNHGSSSIFYTVLSRFCSQFLYFWNFRAPFPIKPWTSHWCVLDCRFHQKMLIDLIKYKKYTNIHLFIQLPFCRLYFIIIVIYRLQVLICIYNFFCVLETGQDVDKVVLHYFMFLMLTTLLVATILLGTILYSFIQVRIISMIGLFVDLYVFVV